VDNAWEQEKPEARKMLENAAESHTSGARFVVPLFAISILDDLKLPIESVILPIGNTSKSKKE
jgi:hypothetical protein